MKASQLYESYHSGRTLQKRLISKWNYSYRILLTHIDNYIKEKRVVDIGCGVGTLDFYLSSKGNHVTGIDISKKAIMSAKANALNLGLTKNTRFFVSEFSNTKMSEKFDLAICTEVLEHMPDDVRIVKKIFDLLKPGGVVIFSSPLVTSPLYKLGLTKKHDKNAGHLRRYSAKQYLQMIKTSGFQIEKPQKNQGIFRESLFTFPFLSFFVRLANRFRIISDIFTLIDNLFLPLGESDIIVVAKKK